MNTNYNGWSTKSAWDLAVTIDNTESLNADVWLAIEDYEKDIYNLNDAVRHISYALIRNDVAYSRKDVFEYIESNSGTPVRG